MEQSKLTQAMVAKVQELMASGASLQEALEQVLVSVPARNSSRGDNVAFILALNDLPEVRRLKKIAYAKISKSKGKPDSIARYKQEIEAADTRLNQIIAIVNADATPWKKAMEYNETPESAFNYFFAGFKDKVDEDLDKLTKAKNMTRADVKAELNKTNPKVSDEVPEILRPAAIQRINNQDMQVITTFRKVAMILTLKSK